MGIPSYFGIDKKDIVILAIKSYKNRPNWTDDYVEYKYKIAIDYMLDNYDRLFNFNKDSSSNSSSNTHENINTANTGARVTKIKQGEREVNYEYSFETIQIADSFKSIIANDGMLVMLLGKPLINLW